MDKHEAQLRGAGPPTLEVWTMINYGWPREVIISHEKEPVGFLPQFTSFLSVHQHSAKPGKIDFRVIQYMFLIVLKFLLASTGEQVQGNPLYQNHFILHSRFLFGP